MLHRVHELEEELEKPKSPIQPLNNRDGDLEYLNYLEGINKDLEHDITATRTRLMQDFDSEKTIESYLTILVITFAEVEALRDRLIELETNFKLEHENRIKSLKHIENLKEYDVDFLEDFRILKELE